MEALEWANSQPVWAQVFIGLFLFFVVLPAVLLAIHLLLSVAYKAIPVFAKEVEQAFFPALLTLVAIGIAYLIFASSEYFGNRVAYMIGDLLSLPPTKLESIEVWVRWAAHIVVGLIVVSPLLVRRVRLPAFRFVRRVFAVDSDV